jgi:hypothetical protein
MGGFVLHNFSSYVFLSVFFNMGVYSIDFFLQSCYLSHMVAKHKLRPSVAEVLSVLIAMTAVDFGMSVSCARRLSDFCSMYSNKATFI